MNTLSGWEKHLGWLLNHSLQAGLLVLLVLLLQWIFRRQLTCRWRFALWWVVLARLLLPFNPESAVSLFNCFKPNVYLKISPQTSVPAVPAVAPATVKAVSNPQPSPSAAVKPTPQITMSPDMDSGVVAPDPRDQIQPAAPKLSAAKNQSKSHPASLNFPELFTYGIAPLWLAGVLGLAGVVTMQWWRFQRRLSAASLPADPGCRTLLEECQRDFGLSRRIELLETDAVHCPALFGLVRLRLLLPRGFGGQFTRREQRYIFLHELAHVKRGDLWLNWLVTGLQILHWFNPLLWLGFARLRADRELACDELALLRAGDEAGAAYGETVVKLLEHLNPSAAVPGLVGILEDKQQMKRRILMIANFRKPGRWSVLALVLMVAMAAAALTDAESSKPAGRVDESAAAAEALVSPARPDLTGQVLGKGGAPLTGPATVFIDTAAPKTGTSTFCPSCYADCSKHARTDAQGNFKIAALDPQLTFRILAVAKGCQPKLVAKVDPAKGPVKIELEPIATADATSDRSLRGRVVDPQGKPIEGAVVEMVGIESKDGGGGYGSLPGVDPLAVTDERGEFLLTAKKPFDMMDVKVSARTFADKPFQKLPSGQTNELRMTEGAALTGRVLRNGQPLGGVGVGISAVDRMAGNYLGHFEVGTDGQGKFTFVNLPPDADFELYTLMHTMKGSGAVPTRQIHTGKDGETTDAGDLIALPAHRLAGRVVLADGQPLPTKVRLLISREAAWDSMQVTLDQAGNFDTPGIPSETISLSARVKGYHVSTRNLSVDEMNAFQLIGRVDHDITNLVFLLEKGPDPQPDYSHIDPEYNEIRQRSLRGAEGAEDHSRDWVISGRVLDSQSKMPVPRFRVTPGQTVNFNQTGWNTLRAAEGSNGFYLVYVNKRVAQPRLKVEADGYLPAGMELPSGDSTNVDFLLKKGSGPAGILITADGKPAAGATLVLLNSEPNQAGLNSAGELSVYGNRASLRVADTNGNFSFKPIFGMNAVAAGSSNGFVVVSLESLATNPTISLAPFGNIIGTLKRASGPGTNEILDVRFTGDNFPRINLSIATDTDAQGRFEFKSVPAGHLQISYREPMRDGHGWMEPGLQEVEVRSGQTTEVNITAPDRQPAADFSGNPPPQPKLMSGVQLKGVVLLPDGKPAADADVALQVEGKYLAIGKGAFSNGGNEDGSRVIAGPDGSFTLPMYEGAKSVIALNEEGYAQVSLEQLKASPQIRLQKWGRIEGTLRVSHHPGTNELVVLDPPQRPWLTRTFHKTGPQTNEFTLTNSSPPKLQPPIYDFNAFQARADDQGRFAITFVPPGPQVIARLVPTGGNSWTHSQLASVEVKPGETLVTNIGGLGRTVIGKVKFADGAVPDFKNCAVTITTPESKYLKKLWQLKTDSERQAFYLSKEGEEFQSAMKDFRYYGATIQPVGSFRAEDLVPGKYELHIQLRAESLHNTSYTMINSAQELTVPPARDKDDDSTVDWGEVVLKKYELPITKTPPHAAP